MNAQHTPEPWTFGEDNDGWYVCGCYVGNDEQHGCALSEANARRIVACVNACAGIPTEQLEIEPYIGSVSYKMRMQAEKQRDELLSALEELANGYAGNGWDVGLVPRIEKARAAIAKVKESK
jgi:hypothetical protein